ncbi:MAG: hypothetical protein ACRDRQ_24905 [Pseudonocardiaceae bacterium]
MHQFPSVLRSGKIRFELSIFRVHLEVLFGDHGAGCGGVPATQVAEWAGHSVEALPKIYAKCLDGRDGVARRRVQEALGHRRPNN